MKIELNGKPETKFADVLYGDSFCRVNGDLYMKCLYLGMDVAVSLASGRIRAMDEMELVHVVKAKVTYE